MNSGTYHPQVGWLAALSRLGSLLVIPCLLMPMLGAEPPSRASALGWLDLEQLSQVRVVTPSRKPTAIGDVPAAISLITSEEIEYAGVTTLPDALRLAPGVQVGQIAPSAWAVSVRGFNSQDSRKLLVLRDGRSVYDTLYSGVWWDIQDGLMDNIDRIEVVRGPGGALWGANAVNGVINVVSKPARDTQGLLVTGGGGNIDHEMVGTRYGFVLDQHTFARVYGQWRDTGDARLVGGGRGNNGYQLGTGGFRLDHEGSLENALTLQGEFHAGQVRQQITIPTLLPPDYKQHATPEQDLAGFNVQARWTHRFADENELQLASYYDYYERQPFPLSIHKQTVDAELQHRLKLGGAHSIVWGGNYRATIDNLGAPNGQAWFVPASETKHLAGVFVQDEIAVVPDRLQWTLGSKFEHNGFTGWEIQPSTRLLWRPDERQTVWAAVSRAVRTPDRTTEFILNLATFPPDPTVPGSIPALLQYQGNTGTASEDLTAYELGYRIRATDSVSVDVALFYNRYDDLVNYISNGMSPGASPPHTVLLSTTANELSAEALGGELSMTWQIVPGWRLMGSLASFRLDIDGPPGPALDNAEGQDPRHQASLLSSWEFAASWRIDASLRYVDSLPSLGVPSYLESDLQVTWRVTDHWEFAVIGRNLFDDHHPEAISTRTGVPGAEVGRSIFGRLSARF